jgi:hypothetical protein
MADFASVLKRAVDALGDGAPSAREAIYKRARDTLANRLAVVGPTPDAIADRQVQALEKAILEVERSYADQRENEPISRSVDMAPASAPTMPEDVSRYEVEIQSEPRPPPAASDAVLADSLQAAPVHSPTIDLPDSAGTVGPVPDQANPGETAEPLDGAGTLADDVVLLVSRVTRLNGSALGYTFELKWGASSVCAVCQKWALCIDQIHCWQRSPVPLDVPGSEIALQ